MAKYRKIDPRIWNDEKFYTASLSCQHLFFFILTHPQLTPVGAMRCTFAGLKEELEWDEKGFPEAFGEAFAEGQAKGFWKYSKRAKFLWVPKFIKYNPPESPNVVRAWGKCWDDLPECEQKSLLYQRLKDLLKGYNEPFKKAFGEAFGEALPKDYGESGAGAGAGAGKEHMSGPGDPDLLGDDPLFESRFQEARKIYPLHPNDNRKDALKQWKARIRAGVAPDEIINGIQRYAVFRESEGTGRRFSMHMKTFLGTSEHWKALWAIAEKVPDDPAELNRVAQSHGIDLPDNCSIFEARKIVSKGTGMVL